MGIIAWIILGLGAGLLANMMIPGRRSQGLLITCAIGVAGALLGGWLATKLFHVHTLHGFFNTSTWLTAIAGAAILLAASRLTPHGLNVDGAVVMVIGAGLLLSLPGRGPLNPTRRRRTATATAHRCAGPGLPG
jgi:uncharacterized membrane protein YeaQ/YmgE (transglycosylase-associated protein family)